MNSRTLNGMMRLINFHLGGALYTMPAVALAMGPTRMALMLTVCAALTYFVYENVADLAVSRRSGSLCLLVSSALGAHAALTLRVLIVFNAFGVIVAYLHSCMDIYAAVAQSKAEAEAFIAFALTVVAGCSVVPFLERACPNMADWGSVVANATLLVLLAVLFWLPPYSPDHNDPSTLLARPASMWELAIAFGPSLVFCFSSAEYVLLACGVCSDDGALLPDADVHGQVRFIGAGSVISSVCIYFAMALGGLRTFGPRVQDDILKNFALDASDRPVLSAVILATNAVSLLLSLPVYTETLLQYSRELLRENSPLIVEQHALIEWFVNPARPYTSCTWIVPLAAAAAQKATGLLAIINLISSGTDYAFMFIFPSLAFCCSFRTAEFPMKWAFNAALALVALFMGCQSLWKAWQGL